MDFFIDWAEILRWLKSIMILEIAFTTMIATDILVSKKIVHIPYDPASNILHKLNFFERSIQTYCSKIDNLAYIL